MYKIQKKKKIVMNMANRLKVRKYLKLFLYIFSIYNDYKGFKIEILEVKCNTCTCSMASLKPSIKLSDQFSKSIHEIFSLINILCIEDFSLILSNDKKERSLERHLFMFWQCYDSCVSHHRMMTIYSFVLFFLSSK